MSSPRTAGRVLACVAAATAIAGCSSDKLAVQAVGYNLASEQVHNNQMLLNIVRASQRRPLEFTTLQSITGSGSSDAQIALELPLAQNGDEQATILRPQLARSGRPTFSISVLDTQEFYQGILRPLTLQVFDFYMKRGLSRRLLFDLFFSGISVTVTAEGDRNRFGADFANDVSDDQAFDDYQTLIEALLSAGLTTTALRSPATVLGPPLTADEALRGDLGAKAASGGLALRPVGWCTLTPRERRDMAARLKFEPATEDICAKGGEPDADRLVQLGLPQTVYRLEKPAPGVSFGLCFQPPPDQPQRRAALTSCQELQRQTGRGDGEGATLALDLSLMAPSTCQALNRHRAFGAPLDCAGNAAIGFGFTARSTYEVIRYLGEVTRRAAYPDYGRPPRVIAIKRDLLAGETGAAPPSGASICDAGLAAGARASDGAECLPLFAVRHGGPRPADPFAAVRYAGTDYVVEAPAGRSDREPTLEAFQVLSELLALNRSAKDLPATTVFTVVGP